MTKHISFLNSAHKSCSSRKFWTKNQNKKKVHSTWLVDKMWISFFPAGTGLAISQAIPTFVISSSSFNTASSSSSVRFDPKSSSISLNKIHIF